MPPPAAPGIPPVEVPPAQRTPVRPLRIDQVPLDANPVPAETGVDAATSARLPVRTYLLQLDDGAEFVVTGRTLVGRDPEPGPGESTAERLPVDDPDRSISKTHLVVELGANGELRVLDRGSTNGTSVLRVDGRVEPVAAQSSTALEAGDVVQFGQRSFRVEQRGG